MQVALQGLRSMLLVNASAGNVETFPIVALCFLGASVHRLTMAENYTSSCKASLDLELFHRQNPCSEGLQKSQARVKRPGFDCIPEVPGQHFAVKSASLMAISHSHIPACKWWLG